MIGNFFQDLIDWRIETAENIARLHQRVREQLTTTAGWVRNILGDGWRKATDRLAEFRNQRNFSVELRHIAISSRKLSHLQRNERRNIASINRTLQGTGWQIHNLQNQNIHFNNRTIRLHLRRTGSIVTIAAIKKIIAALIIFGVIIVGVRVISRGIEIYQAAKQPTSDQVRDVLSVVENEEQARLVQKWIEREFPERRPGFLEQIRANIEILAVLAVIILIIYIVVEYKPLKKRR